MGPGLPPQSSCKLVQASTVLCRKPSPSVYCALQDTSPRVPRVPCALHNQFKRPLCSANTQGFTLQGVDSVHPLCLQDQALTALRAAVDTYERPVFPCALIAGDVVLLHLLHELGYLADKRVTVVFIDTFHLFPETHTFLHQLEVSHGPGFRA